MEGESKGENDKVVFNYAMEIIWQQLAGILWVENGFSQEMKRVSLSEAMWG